MEGAPSEECKIQGTGLSGTIGKHLGPAVKDLAIDLSAPISLRGHENFNPQSHLIHLAGIVGESNVKADLANSIRVNVDAVSELGKEFLEHGEGTFFYVSSSHVYAPSPTFLSEWSPIGPTSTYANQKLEAETILSSIFARHPARLCIIRIFSVLDWGCPEGSLGGTILKSVSSKPFGTISTANDVRSFLTPSKIGETLVEIVSSGAMGIFNLCGSEALTIREATEKMLLARGLDRRILSYEDTHSSRPFLIGDNSKLISLLPDLNLDWKPSSVLET